MGANGFTMFCRNGHVVKEVGHHCLDFDSDPKECYVCGSKDLKSQIEWGDPDYEQFVGLEPIRSEEFVDRNAVHRFELYSSKTNERYSGYLIRQIPVFDVSKLFGYDISRKMLCHLDQCPRGLVLNDTSSDCLKCDCFMSPRTD